MTNSQSAATARRTVKVFGSAVVKVPPDVADITANVSRLEQRPEVAFATARKGAHAVSTHLNALGLAEVGTSTVTLSQEWTFGGGERKPVGYRAKIGFHIVLRDTSRVDEVLTGVIGAGANELVAVRFQTSRLADVRADARRQAVVAARAKAELYANATGSGVGQVLAVEDVSPDSVGGRGESHMRSAGSVGEVAEPEDFRAIDPAAVTVTAAVTIVYELAAAT